MTHEPGNGVVVVNVVVALLHYLKIREASKQNAWFTANYKIAQFPKSARKPISGPFFFKHLARPFANNASVATVVVVVFAAVVVVVMTAGHLLYQ